MSEEQEYARLTSPPPPVPSFWRYLREKNHWVYYNVPMSLLGLVASIFVLPATWWSGIFALVFGLLFGASAVNAFGSWRLWRARKRLQEADAAWVERMSTGERAFPRPIAQAMQNLIAEDKVSAAASLAIEHLKMTDPEARRLFEEFDALPEDEKKRRVAEAMAQADADIAQKEKS